MNIKSIKKEDIVVGDKKFVIIEIKVWDYSLDALNDLMLDIQDYYTFGWDDIDEKSHILTMTFDYIPKEQTMTMIKRYVLDYIENMEYWERRKKLNENA